jgi:peptidoglycan/xylan/chitin deacetylase (PgdA/CDA1 family)
MVVGRILRLIVSLFVALGNVLFPRFSTNKDPFLSILLYHSVKADEGARFARQMDALLKRATPVALLQGRDEILNTHQVAVTFDDGYRSFCEHVLPELVKRNIPATVFVPSRLLGKEPLFSAKYMLQGGETIMSEEELLNLPRDLITIGSHCQTHPHLLDLDLDTAWEEIAGSRRELENLLRRPVVALAFPYGEYSQQTLDLCRRAGYQLVFSALPEKHDGFLWGRIEADPKDWPLEFNLKVIGAYRWLPWAVNLKRKVRELLTRRNKDKGRAQSAEQKEEKNV